MKDKELRGFEFLLLANQILNIFKLSDQKALQQVGWLQWVDDWYLLTPYAFGLFLVGLYRIDGLRMNFIFIMLTEICILSQQNGLIPDQWKGFNLITSLVLVLLSSLVYYFFPVIRQIPLTGKFSVGYTTGEIEKTVFSVFYPTDEKYSKTKDVNYVPYPEYFNVLHFILTKMPSIRMPMVPPKWLVKLNGYTMQKRSMGVINQASLKILPTKTSLVLFSHGISSHMNYSASFCKDLASKGCIVISLQHKDEDYVGKIQRPIQTEEYLNAQQQSVLRRKEQVKQVLDFVLKSNENLASLFPNKEKLKTSSLFGVSERVIMCGHSYGGETALVSALDDDRIFATIALDPVMKIFDLPTCKPLIQKQVQKPFLILCSDNFGKYFYFYKQKEGLSDWLKNNKSSQKLLLPLHMKNMEHVDFIDGALFQPRELQILRKDIYSPSTVTMNHLMLNKLAEFFIFETISSPVEKIDLQKVLDKFDDMCKNNIKQTNPLVRITE